MTGVQLTSHARERMVEFGLGLDVVADIATRPDVAHTNKLGESVRVSDRHPDWTVVTGADDVVITVLRRTRDRWEHSAAVASSSSSARPRLVVEEAYVVDDDPPRRRSPRRRAAARNPAPALQRGVASTTVDPDALALARQLADGDIRRLQLNADGTITILNQPRGQRR